MIAIMSNLIPLLDPLIQDERRLSAGETLFCRGDAIERLHVVREGCIHLTRFDEQGVPAVMQRASANSLLAESSIFAAAYQCDAVVVQDAQVASLPMRVLRSRLASDPLLVAAIAEHLAGEVHRMRVRVEILSRRTVSERLSAWLAFNGGRLPERGRRRLVAEDIGVTSEALYRELARRRAARK